MSVQVDGSKVRIFATRAAATDGARSIGWPVKCVVPVHTRFQAAWALGTGVDLDHLTGLPYLSRERFGELYHDRNDPKHTPNGRTKASDRIRLSNGDVLTLGEALDQGRVRLQRRDNPPHKHPSYTAWEGDAAWDIGEKLYLSRIGKQGPERPASPHETKVFGICEDCLEEAEGSTTRRKQLAESMLRYDKPKFDCGACGDPATREVVVDLVSRDMLEPSNAQGHTPNGIDMLGRERVKVTPAQMSIVQIHCDDHDHDDEREDWWPTQVTASEIAYPAERGIDVANLLNDIANSESDGPGGDWRASRAATALAGKIRILSLGNRSPKEKALVDAIARGHQMSPWGGVLRDRTACARCGEEMKWIDGGFSEGGAVGCESRCDGRYDEQTPNASDTEYRGLRIEVIENATQLGYYTGEGIHRRSGKGRNIGRQYLIHLGEAGSGGTKMVSTIRAAREYIDDYLGPEQTPNARHGRYVPNQSSSPDELFSGAYDAVMEELRRGGDVNEYGAVLAGCVAVLQSVGLKTDQMELASRYHSPLVGYVGARDVSLNMIARGLNETWERSGRGRDASESRASYYEYGQRTADFSGLDDEISGQLKKLKIRRGTKRYAEFLRDLKPRAISAAIEIEEKKELARSVRIDGVISKVLKDAEAKRESIAYAERSVALALALIEAAGVGPTDLAFVAMKEHVEKKDAALEELEGQASYLESTKQGEDPHAVATEWWERAYEA